MKCNCEKVATEGKQKIEETYAMRVLKDKCVESRRLFILALVELFIIFSLGAYVIYNATSTWVSYADIDNTGGGSANYINECEISESDIGGSK